MNHIKEDIHSFLKYINSLSPPIHYQITASSVRLVSPQTKKLLKEWRPDSGKNLSVASCNCHQVVCAVGSELYYLEILEGELKMLG